MSVGTDMIIIMLIIIFMITLLTPTTIPIGIQLIYELVILPYSINTYAVNFLSGHRTPRSHPVQKLKNSRIAVELFSFSFLFCENIKTNIKLN